MTQLIVYYRQSLNMPRGKLIAQLSHALSSFVLGCFDFTKNEFKNSKPTSLIDCVQNTKFVGVADSEFETYNFLVKIEDHGRTVFNGVPTVTCGLVASQELIKSNGYEENEFAEDDSEEIAIRLVQVVDKAYARANFDKAIEDCVKLQSIHLIDNMQIKSYVTSSEFIYWAKGAFAKIVLVCKDGYLDELDCSLRSSSIKSTFIEMGGKKQSCVIGPISKIEIDPYTSKLKMM